MNSIWKEPTKSLEKDPKKKKNMIYEVVKWLRKQGNIRKALNKANQKYPDQALKYGDSNIDDLASHYEYLMQHMNMVKKLGS